MMVISVKQFNFEVITSKCQMVAPALGSKLSLTFRRWVRKSPSSAIFAVMMRQESFDCGHTVNASISSSVYAWSFALGLISSPQIDALLPPGLRKCLLSIVIDVTALVLFLWCHQTFGHFSLTSIWLVEAHIFTLTADFFLFSRMWRKDALGLTVEHNTQQGIHQTGS